VQIGFAEVAIKEVAESKHWSSLPSPPAIIVEALWLSSRVAFKAQLASVDGATRRYMSTAAVEASEPTTNDGIVITDSCIRVRSFLLENLVNYATPSLRLLIHYSRIIEKLEFQRLKICLSG
jgi:hypothetical protein